MELFLIIAVPIAAFLIWGAVYDFRRRRATAGKHNARAAARLARGKTDAGGGGFPQGPPAGYI